jgi:Flp pilus assembly protein TadD
LECGSAATAFLNGTATDQQEGGSSAAALQDGLRPPKPKLQEPNAVWAHIVLVPAALFKGAAADCNPQLEKAKQRLAEQKVQEAQELILASTKACPGDAGAFNLLGLSYDVQERFREAQQAYRKAVELDPKTASFHDNLAVSYLRSGDSAAGIQEFEKVLRLEPHNRTANLNLAAYYLNQRQFSRALGYYRAAGTESSADLVALLGMAAASFGAGDSRSGLDLAQRLSALAASDARIHFSLGLLLAEHGEYSMAVSEFKAIPAPERDFATALNLGMAYSKLGDLPAARQSYEEARRLDPSSPEPALRIGLDGAQSNPNDAIYWLARAYDKAPGRADISCTLAEQLIRVANYDRAEDILITALRQHGEDAALWEAAGDLRLRQNRLQDAVQAYLQSLKRDPGRIGARLSLAQAYRRSGQVSQSTEELEKVLQLDPANSGANAELARESLDAGKQEDALRLAQRVLTTDANNLTANEVCAEVMIRENNLQGARSTLEKLVQLNPANARFHYLLGRVLSKLSLRQEAEREFELSKKLEGGRKEPNSP